MASNVFGNPVTDDTVRLLYPDVTTITARHRAQAALQLMNAENKPTNVSTYVHNLKRAWGTGTSTLVMIYNATGGNLTFVLNNMWEGSVWRSPYPDIIQNGQWAGFLHVRDRLVGPSHEAIVYRGQNNDGNFREWMLAWNTTRMNYQNHVYAEIRTDGSFRNANWNAVNNAMSNQNNNYSTTNLGGFASASGGAGSSPEFVGIMTLAGVREDLAIATDVSVAFESLDSKYVDDDVTSADEAADDHTATPVVVPAAAAE